MTSVYLERSNPERNLYRFYALRISPTLFNHWALVRTWGRIGGKGRSMEQWFETQEEAEELLESLRKTKTKKGYK